jgi:hypothetical protein
MLLHSAINFSDWHFGFIKNKTEKLLFRLQQLFIAYGMPEINRSLKILTYLRLWSCPEQITVWNYTFMLSAQTTLRVSPAILISILLVASLMMYLRFGLITNNKCTCMKESPIPTNNCNSVCS